MANITLYELVHYNNAQLILLTFNLDDIDSQEASHESIHDWLRALTNKISKLCEEWMVADYEDVPDLRHRTSPVPELAFS